jgi:hypothetical protein
MVIAALGVAVPLAVGQGWDRVDRAVQIVQQRRFDCLLEDEKAP